MDDVIDKPEQKKQTSKKEKKYIMPSKPVSTLQYDLFSNFYKESESDSFSNTIELWDAIPKYYISRREQTKKRKDNFLPILRREFKIKPNNPNKNEDGVSCGVAIQPALVPNKNGEDIAYYPSEREELIEKILRKFFEDQNMGFYDPSHKSSWVKFTLKSLQKELKERGHSASIQEIKESIDILSSTVLTFSLDGEEYYRDTILSGLVRVNRTKFENDGSSMWAARLPEMISEAMEYGRYNQYDYLTQMEIDSPLARWLHQLLSRRYKQAGGSNWYDIYFTTVIRDSGYLDSGDTQSKKRKMEKALDTLVNMDVIKSGYEVREKKEGKKILEIHYRVFATDRFKNKWKLNNTRIKNIKNKLS